MSLEEFMRNDPTTVAFAALDDTAKVAAAVHDAHQKITEALVGVADREIPSMGECARQEGRGPDGDRRVWPCDYAGPVDVLLFPSMALWVCPVCGFPNEVDGEAFA